jgi:hypothetical protein
MRADVSLHFLPQTPLDSANADLQALLLRFQDAPVPVTRPAKPPVHESELLAVAAKAPADLFPGVRCPEGALAGLLLFAGCWNAAHELVDDRQTPDACYWHAIIHRMEPDTWNSDYWFRQVGYHPLFPAVLDVARRLAGAHPEGRLRFDPEWNPSVFNVWCEHAREKPHLAKSMLVAAIHSAECHLLWNYSREKSV